MWRDLMVVARPSQAMRKQGWPITIAGTRYQQRYQQDVSFPRLLSLSPARVSV